MTYSLLDRYILEDGQHVIRAKDDASGDCVTILVREEDAEIAASHWGGSPVPCTRAPDGSLWYYRDPDLLTEREADELDRRLALAAARRAAGPGPSDDDLLELLDRPGLSYRQRWNAIRALAHA